MEASTSRLGLCQTCNTAPARYRCPACSHPSCSVACSSAHKTATQCTGVAPAVWERPIQANEMTWGSLMRDQSYIAGVGRAVEEVGRQLVQEKTLPQGRGAGRGRDEGETVRLDERSEKEEKMVREARNEGVELVLLPKGMSKRLKNGTRWDPKNNRLEWTVEVAFQPRPSVDPSSSSSSPVVITIVPQPATASLYTVLSTALAARDKKGKGKEVSPEDAAWVLAEKAWLDSLKPAEEAKPAKAKEQKPAQAAQEEGLATAEGGEVEGDAAGEAAPGEGAEPSALPAEPPATVPSLPEPSSEAPLPETAPIPEPTLPEPAPADDEPPFVLLLAFFSRPTPSFDAESTTTSDAPSSRPSRPSARPLYLVPLPPSAPLSTLRAALSGATLLENPTFELWPRESFLRQKLLGKIRVVEKPTAEDVQAAAAAAASYGSGGRGRGRGRGRGGEGGRGGYGGAREGREDGGGGGAGFEGRLQDSGWGKRGPPAAADEQGGVKKPRLEEQIDALLAGDE
ncbi:hypothetical protein JCM6882_006801 [Rhodosporidiobolus microsporus]